jgi:O-antigen/teichoic acid export membrane protein
MKSLGRNIVANYIGRTWIAILSILFIPIYLKFMGIEAYGLVGFYMVLSNVLGILDLGIGSTMNRELARLSTIEGSAGAQRDVVRTLEIIYWGIAIFAGGLVIVLAPYITSSWINAQTLDPALVLKSVQLMGIALALQFPQSLYQGGLMGLQRQVLVNAILILTGTLRSAGVILVLWLVSPTIEAFLAWQVIVGIVGCVIFIIAMWCSLPKYEEHPRFRSQIIYSVWKYAAAISANAIIGVVLTQIDKVILLKMLTLKMFGYYSIAATVASVIWMIIIPFNTAVFPRFVQLHEMKKRLELRELFHRSSQLLSVLLFPVCALLIVFSREILLLWVHDPSVIENCHLIVSLLVFGTMLNGIASIPSYSATAFGWPQLITYTNIIQAIFIIPLIVALVSRFQGIGAAIAYILLNCTFIIFMVPIYFHRYLKAEMKWWYLHDVAVPAIAAFSVCMFSFLIAQAMHTRLNITGWLMVTGMAAIVTTGLTLPHVRSQVSSWCHVHLIR